MAEFGTPSAVPAPEKKTREQLLEEIAQLSRESDDLALETRRMQDDGSTHDAYFAVAGRSSEVYSKLRVARKELAALEEAEPRENSKEVLEAEVARLQTQLRAIEEQKIDLERYGAPIDSMNDARKRYDETYEQLEETKRKLANLGFV